MSRLRFSTDRTVSLWKVCDSVSVFNVEPVSHRLKKLIDNMWTLV